MSAKKIPREFVETFSKMATKPPVPQTATVDIKPVNVMGTVSKWVPLICAGAAVGVSIMALKEIHNVRKELILAKKELKGSDDLTKRMEMMEQQLKTISEFIKNSKPKPAPPPPAPPADSHAPACPLRPWGPCPCRRRRCPSPSGPWHCCRRR